MNYIQKDGFILQDIMNDKILIPRGKNAFKFSATIVFNETGAFMWENLKEKKSKNELAILLTDKYRINYETALNDAETFLKKGIENEIIQEVI